MKKLVHFGILFALIMSLAQIASAQITSNSPVCVGNNITLFCTAGDPSSTYKWTGPNSFTSNLQNPSIATSTLANQGTYNVMVITASDTDYYTTNIIVNTSKPNKPDTILGSLNVCPNSSTTYYIKSIPNATSYKWEITDPLKGSIVGHDTSAVFTSLGNNYSQYIKVTASNGCGDNGSYSKSFKTYIKPNVAIREQEKFCPNDSIVISTQIITGEGSCTYHWIAPYSLTSSKGQITVKNNNCGDSLMIKLSITDQNNCISDTVSKF